LRNTTDIIEQYIKHVLQNSPDQVVEIGRNDLAEKFQCVPSQINYVIATRFTLEKGYLVESKRGGGGFIRIQRIKLPTHGKIVDHLMSSLSERVDQETAEGLIEQLAEAKLITEREAKMLKAATHRDSIPLRLPVRDEVRAKVLKAMLIALLSK
jgi:transcriptional regulator CtsR